MGTEDSASHGHALLSSFPGPRHHPNRYVYPVPYAPIPFHPVGAT
jgi:hypothetical protein